jgi:hypothetical protein
MMALLGLLSEAALSLAPENGDILIIHRVGPSNLGNPKKIKHRFSWRVVRSTWHAPRTTYHVIEGFKSWNCLIAAGYLLLG